MSFNRNLNPTLQSINEFYAAVNLLKHKGALSEEYFQEVNPYFTLAFIPKETEIKEIFRNPQDFQILDKLLQDAIQVDREDGSNTKTMSFAQICLYKVLPCPEAHCANRPREIVTHNQYKDNECECPFYHHERDRRRVVLSLINDEEFEYKANYFEEGRTQTDKQKYSQNYFESMYHPLYYKMFKCRVPHQHTDRFCPFYHSEQERSVWDRRFSEVVKKDRVTYVKDKQKYYESAMASPEAKQHQLFGTQSPVFSNNGQYKKKNKKTNKMQNQNINFQIPTGEKPERYQSSHPKDNRPWVRTADTSRKNSGDSLGLNTSPKNIFDTHKQMEMSRVC